MGEEPKCNSFSHFRQIRTGRNDRTNGFRSPPDRLTEGSHDRRNTAKSSLDDNLRQMTNPDRIELKTRPLAGSELMLARHRGLPVRPDVQ